MKITPVIVVGLLVVAVPLITTLRMWSKNQGLPPHEFAYGTALKNAAAISEQMDQFLSLEALDPDEIQIETFVGNSSEKNLAPLIAYVSSQRNHDFGALATALKNVDQLSNEKEKAIQLVKTLLPYKDSLRNESKEDSIIVFIYYGLKRPSELSEPARGKVGRLIKQLDTVKQSADFDADECPRSYLVGNINVYPLDLENTSWHSTVEFGTPKSAPILEIRFMGLRGIFRYLLDEMTEKTGDSFLHVDGESL